jgi:hypothetical protein
LGGFNIYVAFGAMVTCAAVGALTGLDTGFACDKFAVDASRSGMVLFVRNYLALPSCEGVRSLR